MIDKLEHRDLASVLRRRVNHCPDKPWIVTAESSYSYRQMDQLSGRLAQGMINQGIHRLFIALHQLYDTRR